MPWVAATTGPNEPIAESWAEILRNHGIPAYVRQDTIRSYLGAAFTPVRIMVPEEGLEEAKRLLDMLVGPEPGTTQGQDAEE